MSDKHLSFSQYQELADSTAIYPGRKEDEFSVYPALGLSGEAGEVSENVKKCIRDDDGEMTEERRDKLIKELGDVLWYIAALCHELDVDMTEVARSNVEKLADRKERGKICGEGDER